MNHSPIAMIGPREVGARFAEFRRLSVRQRKRWAEILLSFEMKNTYDVYDETQSPVLRVQEVGSGIGSLLRRLLLGPLRPFHAEVVDVAGGQAVLQLQRRFRFIFHRLEVHSGGGEPLGAIQRRWSWIRRIYHVEGPGGEVIAELFGPFLRPWTFEIRAPGLGSIGTIQKKWSGLGKELFTDADNFGVDVANISDANLKALSFAATVLIDVVHFERSKG